MKRVFVPRSRSGISLLEVLVSVFVLSVGLLGVAALLPLGQYKVDMATKATRAGVCGRSAMREIMVRDWLNPENWVARNVYGRYSEYNGWPSSAAQPPPLWPPMLPVVDNPLFPTVKESRCIPRKDSFAIDPMFLAYQPDPAVPTSINAGVPRAAWFPLYSVPAPAPQFVTALRRVTIRRPNATFDPSSPFYSVFNYQFFGIHFAAAQRISTWHDDQIFSRPEDPQERPRQFALWDDGNGNMVPGGPATASVLKRLAEDNYTWMATVTPLLTETSAALYVPGAGPPDGPALAYSDISKIAGYEVSIVVFYNRNFGPFPIQINDPENPPQERSAYAVMVGGGFSGGDVFLAADSSVPPLMRDAWVNIKKGDWLMLRGLDRSLPPPFAPPLSGPPPPVPRVLDVGRVVAKWYRVVAVSDVTEAPIPSLPAPVGAQTGRYVTLEGPDWNADTDGDGVFDPITPAASPPANFGNSDIDWAEATLVEDVIGVYTSTIILDQQ